MYQPSYGTLALDALTVSFGTYSEDGPEPVNTPLAIDVKSLNKKVKKLQNVAKKKTFENTA